MAQKKGVYLLPRLRNLLIHQIPGTGEEEDEYHDCDKIAVAGCSGRHSHGQDRKGYYQDHDGCKPDDNIKNSFVHYLKFALPDDIGLSDFLQWENSGCKTCSVEIISFHTDASGFLFLLITSEFYE